MWAAGQPLGMHRAALETLMAPGEVLGGLVGLGAGDGAGLSTTFSCNARISFLAFILAEGSVRSPPQWLLHPPETCPWGCLGWQRAQEVAAVGCQEQRRVCACVLGSEQEGELGGSQSPGCSVPAGCWGALWGVGLRLMLVAAAGSSRGNPLIPLLVAMLMAEGIYSPARALPRASVSPGAEGAGGGELFGVEAGLWVPGEKELL